MDRGSATAPALRRPALAAVVAIVVVTLGGRLAASAVDGDGAGTVGLEGIAAISPPSGWTEDPAARRDDGSTARFVLTKGSAVLVLSVLRDAGLAAPALADAYVREVLGPRVLQVTRTPGAPVVVGGVPGVQTTYLALTPSRAAVEGVVTAAVAPGGAAIVLDGFAPEGALAGVARDLSTIAREATLA